MRLLAVAPEVRFQGEADTNWHARLAGSVKNDPSATCGRLSSCLQARLRRAYQMVTRRGDPSYSVSLKHTLFGESGTEVRIAPHAVPGRE